MEIDYNNRNVVDIVASMIGLIENNGLTPVEVVALVDKLKEATYEELIYIYNNQ